MPRGRTRLLLALAICLVGACSVTIHPIVGRDGGDGGRGDASGTDGSNISSRCNGYVGVDAESALSLSRGLVAYYPCEQASGTTLPDQSGNGRNATLATNESVGYAFVGGKVGKALRLNSASGAHVVLPDGLLANACEATVATWIYLNSQNSWQRVWTFSTGGSVYAYLATSNDKTGLMRFGITLNANIGDDQQFVDGPNPLPVGSWSHVAVVLGPSGVVVYVNGEQAAASTAITLRPSDLGKTVYDYIGRSNYSWDPYLDGSIDEFRIYNRALSHAEVQALFNGS